MTRIALLLALVVIACLTAATRAAQGLVDSQPPTRVPVLPVDESEQDPSLKSFRDDLLAAVRAKDADKVWASFAPNSKTLAVSGLQHSLKSPDSPDWEELERILSMGGAFTTSRGAEPGRREFCAPHIYGAYPSPRPRGFGDPWVIISELALVRKEPNPQAPVLLSLSYELVRVNGTSFPTDAPEWFAVILPGGDEGWVLAREIRDPADYHICFAKIEDVWMMTTFAQGAPGG